jgi:hypothetical protein
MYEIKDVSKLESIHGGAQCDFINATECQLLYTAYLIPSIGLVMTFTISTFNSMFAGAVLGLALGTGLYKMFGGSIIPKCALPADYINLQESCL